MNKKSKVVETMIAFCVCTTCITIFQGVMGVCFFPNTLVDYGAFFSPPVFGFFSVLLGAVTESKKELTVRQVLFRYALHLFLIEGMVFGANYMSGNTFTPLINICIALGIAIVFVLVYVITWINERRYAADFNERLKAYQQDKI